jgi:predicted permease
VDFVGLTLTLLGPLIVGYLGVRLGLLPRAWSKPIQRATILLLAPPVTLLAMWGLDVTGATVLGVPLIALAHTLGGMLASYGLARALGLTRRSSGAFVAAGGWSNTWLLAGYLCFSLFGRQGLALAALYNILHPPLFYLVGFAMAGFFSASAEQVSVRGAIKRFFTDPVSLLPNIGLLTGVALNLAGVEPGAWFDPVSAYLVPAFTIVSMFAVGMTMSFRRPREFVRPILGQAFVKYLVWPAITLGIVAVFRGSLYTDPVTFRVLVILSCMPVAMQGLLLSNLFDLDMDLANATWLATTLFSLATAPLLVYGVRT